MVSQVQVHGKMQLLTLVLLLQKAGYEVYAMQALELNPKVSKEKLQLAPLDAGTIKLGSWSP